MLSEVLHGALQTEKLPFRPYTLPALLRRGWLLADHEGIVNKWREQMHPYPELLKHNVIKAFAPTLSSHTNELVLNATRNLGTRNFIFHLNWAVDALISILLALNEVYDPAERRTERVILPELTLAPDDFTARLSSILSGPFNGPHALHQAQRFKQLTDEALAMAKREVL